MLSTSSLYEAGILFSISCRNLKIIMREWALALRVTRNSLPWWEIVGECRITTAIYTACSSANNESSHRHNQLWLLLVGITVTPIRHLNVQLASSTTASASYSWNSLPYWEFKHANSLSEFGITMSFIVIVLDDNEVSSFCLCWVSLQCTRRLQKCGQFQSNYILCHCFNNYFSLVERI